MFQETKELTITSASRFGKWHLLAEMIRRGSRQHPEQGFGEWSYDGAYCAMGAANAVGYEGKTAVHFKPCPVCKTRTLRTVVLGVVIHLNDHHGWTRERIADYLDTL